MSFEIFLQRFDDVASDSHEAVDEYVRPFRDKNDHHVLITTDGSAEVFGLDDRPLTGCMFSHVAGTAVWDVIFGVAVRAGWVIMPVGCPVCLVDEAQAESLPPELLDLPCVVVHSGAEIRRAIMSD